jgi:small, acid-soluble spore protein tlp
MGRIRGRTNFAQRRREHLMAKPDDRSDNVEKLQRKVQNTIENYREAEEYLEEHADEIAPQEAENIRAKNERRKQSIEGFRDEIRDEARSQR